MTLSQSLLVAVDLSEASGEVLAEAARLGQASGCQITLVHVIEQPSSGAPAVQAQRKRRMAEEARGAAHSVLLGLRERYLAGVPDVAVRTVENESVVHGLCAVAAELHADLVLLSMGGRWGAAQVPEELLRVAPCRVLVLPAKQPTSFAH
jgi:nucleotide-binding universal stress UspA family protein